jgi:hypothetical protein
VALNEDIRVSVCRWAEKGRQATEVFMSGATQHRLADELLRRIPENYHDPKHFTMRGKAKAVDPTEMSRRVPTELTFGSIRVKVRVDNAMPTGTFRLDFKKLVKQVDYRTGQEVYVAQP